MEKIIKYINKNENKLLKNISFISFLLIIVILLILIIPLVINSFCDTKYNLISTQFTITTIGAIIAFWYGYKKYERDKEIKNLELLLNEYFEINFDQKIGYLQLLFNYKKEGYISNYIFEYIDKKFWFYIDNHLYSYINKLKKDSIDNKEDKIIDKIESKFKEMLHTTDKDYVLYLEGNFEKLYKNKNNKYKDLYLSIFESIKGKNINK